MTTVDGAVTRTGWRLERQASVPPKVNSKPSNQTNGDPRLPHLEQAVAVELP